MTKSKEKLLKKFKEENEQFEKFLKNFYESRQPKKAK